MKRRRVSTTKLRNSVTMTETPGLGVCGLFSNPFLYPRLNTLFVGVQEGLVVNERLSLQLGLLNES